MYQTSSGIRADYDKSFSEPQANPQEKLIQDLLYRLSTASPVLGVKGMSGAIFWDDQLEAAKDLLTNILQGMQK